MTKSGRPAGDIEERTCPVCGQIFCPTPLHVFRTINKEPVCSWSCLCAYRDAKAKRFRGVKQGRPVLMVDGDGKVLRRYRNAVFAAAETGGSVIMLWRACRNGAKYMGAYWKYEFRE